MVEDVNVGDEEEVVVAVRPRFSHDGTVLRSFTQAHPGGALALFDAEGWETYTVDPERTWRAAQRAGSDDRGRRRRLGCSSDAGLSSDT